MLRRNGSSVDEAVRRCLNAASTPTLDAAAVPAGVKLISQPPQRFSVMSWNIDGLDGRQTKLRTKAACKVISDAAADVVMLQELVPATCRYMRARLCQYEWFPQPTDDSEAAVGAGAYFTAVLLRKYRVYGDSSRRMSFSSSQMGRDLLRVDAHIGRLRLALFTSHLESTGEMAAVRVRQLTECWRAAAAVPSDHVVLLAGDLNLRDAEVPRSGGIPDGFVDVWQQCGERETARFTWDASRNSNIGLPGGARPRLRFDRIYVRAGQRVEAEFFGLDGIERIEGSRMFVSDHWAVRAHFKINDHCVAV